jgi:hypothetical protein
LSQRLTRFAFQPWHTIDVRQIYMTERRIANILFWISAVLAIPISIGVAYLLVMGILGIFQPFLIAIVPYLLGMALLFGYRRRSLEKSVWIPVGMFWVLSALFNIPGLIIAASQMVTGAYTLASYPEVTDMAWVRHFGIWTPAILYFIPILVLSVWALIKKLMPNKPFSQRLKRFAFRRS